MMANIPFPRLKNDTVSPWMAILVVLGLLFALPDKIALAQHGHGHGTQGGASDLGDMVIIANKIESFIEQNPSQVISMTAKEIEKRNFLQVQEVLSSMPGVDVKSSTGGLGARIAIRGGGGSGSVLVLIDGRPAATMQYGGVDLSSIPIDIVKKITVFKPPVPVWLGPDSAAGAIYIETRTKKIRAKKGASGKVRMSGGSYGLVSGSATGQFDTDLSQILASGGYFHKDGRRENSQKDQGHLSIGYNRNRGGRQLAINTKAFASHHGVAGPVFNPTPDAEQRYEKASLDLKYKGFHDTVDYTFKTWGDYKNLDETANDGSPSRLDTLAGGLGTDVSILGGSEENELKLGALGEHIRVDHTLTGEHDRTRLSAHAETNIRKRPLVYTLGARAEYTNDFDFSPGGHAGISYAVAENTVLKANTGYSEHIPTFSQLYQPSHGAVDQVRGNPDLDKEKILSLTAGAEHQFLDRHTFVLTLFRTETWDLIKYRRDDNMVNEPVNIDRAVKQGIETSVKLAFSKQTGIDISYVWQDTENKENGYDLSYAPKHTVKLVFKTAIPSGTRFEWITRGYSDQYSDIQNSEDEKLDAYLATDVKLSHPVRLFNKKTLFFANIHNLFDTDYSSHYGYPDDGFKIELGISISF